MLFAAFLGSLAGLLCGLCLRLAWEALFPRPQARQPRITPPFWGDPP